MTCLHGLAWRVALVVLLAGGKAAHAGTPPGADAVKTREQQLAEDRKKELPMKIVDVVVGVCALGWGIYCLWYLWKRIPETSAGSAVTTITSAGPQAPPVAGKRVDLATFMVLSWVLGPPIYFALETVIFNFEHNWNPPANRLDALKHGQELARNFWIAMGALVITLYTHGSQWLKR